ncbi:MAG: sigma-70 family RNA polymerase sigma factor [Firmicutes bacterium]|nr:sigma-70 family RNA polymerase sigma factor [Bacillota bacterium]
MLPTDYDVIQSCLKGDSDAFAEIVNRYKKLIYTVVYRMMKEREEANDIAQEVFIKIYRSLDRYDPQYKFSTWSVKIATNYCLDILRKKKLNTVSVDEMIHVPSSEETPETSYLKTERKQEIRKAIDDLPEKYKMPIILFHEHGLSYDEICKVLNEPLSIVKNRLHRARHMLRGKLIQARKEEVL